MKTLAAWVVALCMCAAATVSADDLPAKERNVLTAHNLAAGGQCDAVRMLADVEQHLDAAYYKRVFLADSLIARCFAPAADAARVTPPAVEPPVPEKAEEDCGQGLYLEPSLLAGTSYRGEGIVIGRTAGGLELHNCDAQNHWTRAYRVGGTLSTSKYGGGYGLEAEVEFVTAIDRRIGLRVGYDSISGQSWSATGGVRYHVADVAFGIDLVALDGGYAPIPKGILGNVTLGGRPGRYVIGGAAILGTIGLLLLIGAMSGGH